MVKTMMGTKADMTVDREIQKEVQRELSRNGQDRIFALKQNERDCPMTDFYHRAIGIRFTRFLAQV